jgi:UDP-N-acetylmuramoylalanine--D-glutamate ligase
MLVPASVEPGGTAVIAVDDRYTREAAERVAQAGKKVVRVSVVAPLREGLYAEGTRIVGANNGKASAVAQLTGIGSLRGVHNAQNAAAAIAVAQALGVGLPDIQKALTTFPGLPHRMEEVGRLGKVLYVNDSKATNADSAARALASFADIYWIAGGKPKTGGITPLAEFFPKIRKAYLIGEAANEFASTLEGKVPYEMSGVLSVAIDAATRDAQSTNFGSDAAEPVVLLSPACASFDQYRNFEVRGTAFRDIVLGLPGIKPRG